MKKLLFLFIYIATTIQISAQQDLDCKSICTINKTVYEDAYLGVVFGTPCDRDIDKGVIIIKVVDHTPAKSNGLQPYDIVLKINDLEVNRRGDAIKAIAAYQPFDMVRFTIYREGRTFIKTITLGAKNTKIVQEKVCCNNTITSLSSDNINVHPVPVAKDLYIDFKEVIQDTYQFSIYMNNGVLVKSYKKQLSDRQLQEVINVEKFDDGVYILKITHNNQSYSKLFVVKRN